MNIKNLSDEELLRLYHEKTVSSVRFDIKQHAAKILINAVYGSFGSNYFQYYDLKNAEAVTATGQFVIKYTETIMNNFLNKMNKTIDKDYVTMVDTDSVFINLEPIVAHFFDVEKDDPQKIADFLDKFCKSKIDPMLEKTYQDIFEKLNCFENHLFMKREKIMPVAVMKAKKRYMFDAIDNEGVRYAEPKFGVTGLSIVSSTTPVECKKPLEVAFKIILRGNENELQQYVQEFREKFFKLAPEKISTPSSANDLEKYKNRPSGTPFHIRGALMFNDLIKQHKLTKSYELIRSKDKIKTLPLKTPNIIQEHVIAFVDKLPQEFELHKYVDYDTQFEKVFLKPLRELTEIVEWDVEKRNKLSAFY